MTDSSPIIIPTARSLLEKICKIAESQHPGFKDSFGFKYKAGFGMTLCAWDPVKKEFAWLKEPKTQDTLLDLGEGFIFKARNKENIDLVLKSIDPLGPSVPVTHPTLSDAAETMILKELMENGAEVSFKDPEAARLEREYRLKTNEFFAELQAATKKFGSTSTQASSLIERMQLALLELDAKRPPDKVVTLVPKPCACIEELALLLDLNNV